MISLGKFVYKVNVVAIHVHVMVTFGPATGNVNVAREGNFLVTGAGNSGKFRNLSNILLQGLGSGYQAPSKVRCFLQTKLTHSYCFT